MNGPRIAGAVFQWKPGGTTINSTVEVIHPNERIGWTGTAKWYVFGMSGALTFQLLTGLALYFLLRSPKELRLR